MRYILKELQRHFLRTVLSITGYAVAAFFILILLSITNANKKDSFGILQSTGTHLIIYIPTNSNCCPSDKVEGCVFAEGVNTTMLDNSLIQTIKKVDGIRDAAPYLLYRMYHEKFRSNISIGGVDTGNIATNSNVCARTNVIAGKFLSNNPNEIVAEESFTTAHKLSLGDTLPIFGGKMVLSGIVNSGIKPAKADFYAPIEFVRNILRNRLECNATSFDMNIILVEVADARFQNDVINRLKKLMYKFSISSYNCYEPAYKVMSIIENSSTGLTILILVFLIIFSAKNQLDALMERFREIGILKSLGWSDFNLSIQVLAVSVIHSLIGITIGLFFGFIAIYIVNSAGIRFFNSIELHFQYSGIPGIFSLSLIGALISCIFPIYKIFKTKAGDIMNNYL